MKPHFTNTGNPVDFPKMDNNVMNERIQELAYQAEDYADSIVDQGGEFHQAYTQKLAELIVRECVKEIHVADVGDLKGKGYYLDKVAEHIEKHFGVGE